MPGLPEQKVIMAWAQAGNREHSLVSRCGMLKFDVKSAHRLVRKHKRDWRFLVMKLGEEFYCNTVGTFGESSASYWWARVYSAFHRLLYYVGAADAWGLVYADDSLWHLPLQHFWEEAALILCLLTVLGVPIA